MRTAFWRGIIAGGIIGVAMSMMAGGMQRQEKKSILGYTGRGRNRTNRMMRTVSKTVNNLIK